MSNVIQFRSKQSRFAESEADKFSAIIKQSALHANVRDALSRLADKFEIAVQHARAIEPRMRDPKARQDFGDRIEIIERLLDVVRLKLLQL